MAPTLDSLKIELERFGRSNDEVHTERELRMLNITRDTGEFLALLVRATHAQRILEIGTSNGYSTLWLAEAAKNTGGTVTTVELSDSKVRMARETFARSGLSDHIRLLHEDAGSMLERSQTDTFDLLFLDSERSEYPRWWPRLKHVIRPGGLLVVDYATSHPEQMAPFMDLVQADPAFTTCLATVGNGEFMAVREQA